MRHLQIETRPSRRNRHPVRLLAIAIAVAACGGAKVSSESGAGVEGSTDDGGADESCFRQVSAGGGFTCVVKADGTLWCWGANTLGQLGLGNTETPRPEPAQVTTLGNDVAQVTTGSAHACAVKTDGTAWCWGHNNYGQLGDGTYLDRTTPGKVHALGSDVVQMSAGDRGTCAVKTNGTVWCWGYGPLLGVGLPAAEDRAEPVQVTALGSEVAQVHVAGGSHTCAVKTDGTLWCWGKNRHGQLGDGTTEDRLEPIRVAAMGGDVAHVIAEGSRTCAVKAEGSTWCWGQNLYGQVGDGTDGPSGTPRLLPVRVETLGFDARELSAGPVHTCARQADGTVWCWGRNEQGLIGDGQIDTTCELGGDWTCQENRPEPVRVIGFESVAMGISSGSHTCARLEDDTVWCWGDNGAGQLGDGTNEGETCPQVGGTTPCRPSPVRALIECL